MRIISSKNKKIIRNIALVALFLGFNIFIISSLKSCYIKANTAYKHLLPEQFYWAECENQDAELSENTEFKLITDYTKKNLAKLADNKGSFIWVKTEFTIPEQLKNKDLGLVIPYLHFADKGWINGVFAGSYGRFPPDEESAQYQSHYYHFPKTVLNQEGTNTFLLKIYVKGEATLTGNIILAEADVASHYSQDISFMDSKVYMLFEGGMFATFIMFLTMYFMRRHALESFDFAMMNLSTMLFVMPFFASSLPLYTSSGIPHLLFIKTTLCCGGYFTAFFTGSLLEHFFQEKLQPFVFKIRLGSLLAAIVITLAVPDYTTLMKISPFMIILIIIQVGYGIWNVIKKSIRKETRKKGLLLLICFFPVLLAMCYDIPVKLVMGKILGPYTVIFGWQATIISFLMVISIRYANIYKEFEQLNTKLEQEVASQTADLKAANELLESEKRKATIELEMASLVQKKLFPEPEKQFMGWDLSIVFEPLNKVSGDLYDYFEDNFMLNGLSVFDISGHGMSASLVSMLSKNIIRKNFLRGRAGCLTPTEILSNISKEIIEGKGDIDSYLTGILLSIEPFTKTDECTVHLANGGHPHPILYRAAEEHPEEIIPKDTSAQFGAIGIKDFDVSFPTIDFYMAIDDILVLFTDGVTEAENIEREQFGKIRLKSIIAHNSTKSASEISQAIKTAITEYMAPNKAQDDITIIVLKRTPSEDFIEEI